MIWLIRKVKATM